MINLQHHIGQRELFEARQAQRGVIRAVRVGKPGANRLSGEIRPLQTILKDREWAAHAQLFMIEMEAANG